MKTILWPPAFNGHGGIATTSDPEVATAQLVALSLVPGRSANPWDVVDGAGADDETYDVAGDDDSMRAFVKRRMERLERGGYARLLGPIAVIDGGDGERIVEFAYVDLRTKQEQKYTSAG